MISIAMTTYNGEKYLHEQIKSILLQSFADFELVICDDCSTDTTKEIIENYCKLDNRITFCVNESNLGFMKNFEKVISLCKGEYIALCDQDDIWMPNHLEILYEKILEKECSLVGGNALLVDGDNNSLNTLLINNQNIPNVASEYENMLLYRNIFQGAAIMFEKKILSDALPFPNEIRFHDWWLALIASEKKGVYYVNEPVLRYRQHGYNVTGFHSNDTLKQKIKNFFTNDMKHNNEMLIKMLKSFIHISKKEETINCVIEYLYNCNNKNLKAIRYFRKHYGEIFFNEKKYMKNIRSIKLFFDILIGIR